ncbi:hypothetical protein CPB83DRAFT_854847 [Crepidotus variabilis]|uniref:Uncharacterized protein n=1 Tax=Crepidotus variabilis TaxID=179855 RepID=A0A9P6EFR5_9AGAR|nr:hypothetical protein CPB83DRAFT_854847 [Crepidotus variabilis]
MESFWRIVYERNPQIPSCPDDLAFPKWTTLLFGEPICEECRINRGMLNFYLRRRLCERCTLDLCMTAISSQEQISRQRPELVERFRRVLYPVELNPGRIYPSPGTGTIWHIESDVFKKMPQLVELSDRAQSGDAETITALTKFEAECEETSAKLSQHAIEGNQWGYDITQEIEIKSKRSVAEFAARCLPLLHTLNHDPRDARPSAIEYALMPYRPLKFTKRNFRRYLPVVEAEIGIRKARRLERERDRLVTRRTDTVSDLWADYLRDKPHEGCVTYQPTDEIVAEYGLFRYYISDDSTAYENLERERAYAEFDHLVSEWDEDCKRRLVLASLGCFDNSTTRTPREHLLTPSNLSRMQLAISVYTCQRCKSVNRSSKTDPAPGSALLGTSEALQHMKCVFGSRGNQSFELNYRASATVNSLLQILDLEPNMTFRRDLDRLDARFVCLKCFDACLSTGTGLLNTLIWRECIVHEMTNLHGSSCEWGLLSPEATRSIRLVEEVWPSPDVCMWYCNHCPEFYHRPDRFDTVAIHVETDHRIVIPTLDVDVGYVLETATNTRQPFGISPHETYRCRLCSGLDRLELRRRDVLVNDHFAEAHPDEKPTEDNIESVQLIERVNPTNIKRGLCDR